MPGDIPGLISRDEVNPGWFGFQGGQHILIRSFHVGDRFFASNWPATNRTAFLDWAQAQGPHGVLKLRVTRRKLIWPQTWELEFSPSLGIWSPGKPGDDYETIPTALNGNGTETVIVTMSPTKSTQFFRVVAK